MSEEYGQELAVVIVTYSPGETLERCLDTLEKATTRPYRVVLADNGSVDGAPEKAADARDNVTLLHTGGNLGYGTAANRGVATFGREYGWIMVANPDLQFGDGCVDTMLAAADRWPRGGAFGPLIRQPTGEIYPSARMVPSIGKGIGHAVAGRLWPSNPWTKAYKQVDTVVEREAGWLSGSCLLMRREAFDSIDGFDTRYFMYFEDVDLGDRLTKAGWQNVYVPSAEVVHIQGHSTARASDTMLAVHHESAYRFIADRHQGLRWAPVRAGVKAGLALRLKAETRKKTP